MGRKTKDKNSESYWVDRAPECKRNLFHILKYHPLLCDFFERIAYKRGGDERSYTENVPVFSADRKNEPNIIVTRNTNVEKKMTPYSSVEKDSIRSKLKAIVLKEISKKRSRHHRSSTFPIAKSFSFPTFDSSSKRQTSGATSNGYLPPKGNGKSCFDNKPKADQFESTKKFYFRSMSLGARRFNQNESMMARDVNCSSGSDQGQNQNEIKQFKNLKQKIEHVTGESKKEKLRVTMDAVIDKVPQGHGISDDVKKDFLKKLTDTNMTTEGENYAERCSESDHSTTSFTKHHKSRKLSLQEPLEIYYQLHENSFSAEEPSDLQSKELKLRTDKEHSPLRMLVPLKSLSVPDLQSLFYGYQNWEFPECDGIVSSETISHMKKDNNLHSKSQIQLDTSVENLIQKHLGSVGETDLLTRNAVEPGSDNSHLAMTSDDFGHSCLKNGCTYNDQDVEPIKEYKTTIAASDSKLNTRLDEKLDNMVEQQEAIMDSLKVNHDTPLFHVDTKDKAEFDYVKYILMISGLIGKDSLSAWHSIDHPLDPLLYEEMESDPDFCSYGQCNHHVLFDLINETLLELSGMTYCYCFIPSSSSSSLFHTSHPIPKSCHTLYQVWTHMSKSLCLRSQVGLTIDDHVSRDLSRGDGWVNPQLFAQCVGVKLEDLIFHDLLEEITCELSCI